jgi:hypothetical protein
MALTVFDDVQRPDASPCGHAESVASYLNRSAMDVAVGSRALIETWFARLCEQQRLEVRDRLRSDDDRHFYAGFWELYLHEVLTQMGYAVECHPTLPHTSKHPDYLVRRGEAAFYLEATIAGLSNDEIASDRRRGRIYEYLDSLDSPNFFLWIDVETEGPRDPPARSLRQDLKCWLDSLDPDLVPQNYKIRGELPIHTWQNSGWLLRFQAFAKAPEHRGEPGVRPIGGVTGKGGWIDDRGSLLTVLKSKAGRYGTLGAPYVIAVLEMGQFAWTESDWHRMGALYGSAQVTWGPDTRVRHTRAPDGFWLGRKGPQNRRVSGVLLAASLHPWAVAKVVPEFWSNPFAQYPLQGVPGLFPHKRLEIQGNRGALTTIDASISLLSFLKT